jgi:predicted metal-dependent phosphoesterase TrpH
VVKRCPTISAVLLQSRPESLPQVSAETQRYEEIAFFICGDLCTVVNLKWAASMSATRKFDFHCHSRFSDGSLAPVDLLILAKERGVELMAITDHDTVNGYSQTLQTQAAELGIELISGCEISCQWQRRGIHVVGLNMDLNDPVFRQAMQTQGQARLLRAESITNVLKRLGFEVELSQVQVLAGNGTIGRPHFARHLVDTGQMPSMATAFKRVLGGGKPGDIKANWPTLEAAVEWITQAGGVAVLAHPLKYKITMTKLRSLLADFVQAGGRGMEVITGHQEPNKVRALVDLALRHDLYASAGSDFHTPGQPWAALGHVQPLPESCRPVWEHWS